MFDGIKILCLGPNKDFAFSKCLRPTIVSEKMFLKVANTQISCPDCGHTTAELMSFFLSLIEVRKAANKLKMSGFYVKFYELTIESC